MLAVIDSIFGDNAGGGNVVELAPRSHQPPLSYVEHGKHSPIGLAEIGS